MAEFTIACPHCLQHLMADVSMCGQTVNCPSCVGEIIVPAPPTPKPAPKVASFISAPPPKPAYEDQEDEVTLFTMRPATRAYLGRMIAAGVWCIICIIALFVIHFNTFGSIVLPPLVIGGITGLGIWIETHSTEYKLTTQRFFLKKGLIAKHLDELELYRIKDVIVNQGIIQRLMGFGSVIILSGDESSPKILMKGIANPTEVKELIRKTYRVARKKEGVRAAEFMPS